MKKTPLSLALASIILCAGCNDATSLEAESPPSQDESQSQPAAEASPAEGNATLVRVNDAAVTPQIFAIYQRERMLRQPQGGTSDQDQMVAMEELVKFYLLSQDAEKRGLDKRDDVAAALQLQRTQYLAKVAAQDFLLKNLPSEEDIKARYQERFAGPVKEYKARHILLETEQDAKNTIVELEQGSDFVELAKTRSKGPTGRPGVV